MQVVKIYETEEWYPELPLHQNTNPDQDSTLYIQPDRSVLSTQSIKSYPNKSKKLESRLLARSPRRSSRVCSKFRCPDINCKLVFKTMELLIEHMEEGHIYSCPIDKCNHTDHCLNSLAKHIMSEHQKILKKLVSEEAMDLYSLICENKPDLLDDESENSLDISRKRLRSDSDQDVSSKKPRIEDEMLIVDCLLRSNWIL